MQLENQGRELAGRETLQATICCCQNSSFGWQWEMRTQQKLPHGCLRTPARLLSGACLGSPFLHLPGLHEAIAWKWFEGDAALKGSLLYDSNLSKMPPGQEPGLLTPMSPDTAHPPQKTPLFLEFLFIRRLF